MKGNNNPVVYLFDLKKDFISISDKTLYTPLKNSVEENYKNAVLRKNISDYSGALFYLNQSLSHNERFQASYVLKMEIYLNLNQYDNAMLNLFKSCFISLDCDNKKEPLIFNLLYDYCMHCDYQKTQTIKRYIQHYSVFAKQFDNFDQFAKKLIFTKRFKISALSDKNLNYNFFLKLEEV